MGMQVNFYMTPEDEREFVAFVRSDRNVGIFKYAIPSQEIPFLNELPPRGEPFWFALFLWDRENSPPPVLHYIKEQHYFVADDTESELVEFSRCNVDEGRLVRGRIWAEMNGWKRDDPATIFRKSAAFEKWFKRLANWIKRRSTRAGGDYLLPGAAAFAAKGSQFSQAVFAGGKSL